MNAKKRLKDSLFTALASKSIDDITVSEIVEGADLCRATFYRYYDDKYDLLNQSFQETLDTLFAGTQGLSDQKTRSQLFFEYAYQNRDVLNNAFATLDYNGLKSFCYRYAYSFLGELFRSETPGLDAENAKMALEVYCRGIVETTADWIRQGMKVPPVVINTQIFSSLPQIFITNSTAPNEVEAVK
jgi:AcrR family transcriptional regulator